MKRFFLFLFLWTASLYAQSIREAYQPTAQRLIEASLQDSVQTWNRLAELCDTFGPRFSGSQNLEDALDWIVAEMKKEGYDSVYTQPVKVPNWKRGMEALQMVAPRPMEIPMMGLGGSIGTPPQGIKAEVLVVNSFDELEQKIEQVKGKILLFNAPFTEYRETVQYRVRGASIAASAGAVASIIRSVASASMITPHTGGMTYAENAPKIPAAAISTEHAQMLRRMQDRGVTPVLHLYMEGHFEPDADSRNVVAEIRGSEFPDEVVVMGGHIDSWDVGLGAMDDGGGSVVSWEALRIIKKLGLRPKRTIRVVLWTNEENGLRGGKAYRDTQVGQFENHVLAIESDSGVFAPKGFGFTGSDAARMMIEEIGTLLEPIGANQIKRGGGGADIGPIMQEGVPGAGLNVEETKYFWYHHTHADTPDKLLPTEMGKCTAAMAILSFVVADMPTKLPR